MAKFPDGTILMYKANARELTVEVTTQELIKCKNCLYCSIEQLVIDGNIMNSCEYCNLYKAFVNPEGYCYRASRKDVADG